MDFRYSGDWTGFDAKIIGNYRFGIFNFDAELEWCKFRALTVAS